MTCFWQAGFPSGTAYAITSLSGSFNNIDAWTIVNGLHQAPPRLWVSCYFNATRESSYQIQAGPGGLGVKIASEQKLTPFPSFAVSTSNETFSLDKRYDLLSEPVSEWFVSNEIAQVLGPWNGHTLAESDPPNGVHANGLHTYLTMHNAVDYYYGIGALINFYTHSVSTPVTTGGGCSAECGVRNWGRGVECGPAFAQSFRLRQTAARQVGAAGCGIRLRLTPAPVIPAKGA